MRLKTKIVVVCSIVAACVTASMALMFIGTHAIRFYSRNIQHNSSRLNEYLKLRTYILRSISESFKFHNKKFHVHTDTNNSTSKFNGSKQDAKKTLDTLNNLNQQYLLFLNTRPTFLLDTMGHTIHDNILVEIERTKKIETLANHILSKIDISLLNETSIIDMTKIVEILYDNDFNQLISDNIRDQEYDLKRSYIQLQSLRVQIDIASFLLLISTYGTLGYLIFETRHRAGKKMEQLMDAVKSLRQGNYSTNLNLAGHDELNDLADALNNMSKEISSHQASLSTASKMSALGEMAGGIAHEINNPLQIISARATQIKRLVGRETIDSENILKFAESIEQTTQRIAKIITGLRSFSRNAENDPFHKALLKDVVQDTLSLCAERFKGHYIDLKIDDIATHIEIECRATQIIQVLVNILNNALDAVDSLSEKWVHIKVEENKTYVRLKIIDSGTGISQPIAEKLFQPFFTTKEVGKGTGLGLSIARGIVADHKGQLFIDASQKNTCFVLELPKLQTKTEST